MSLACLQLKDACEGVINGVRLSFSVKADPSLPNGFAIIIGLHFDDLAHLIEPRAERAAELVQRFLNERLLFAGRA